MTDRRISSLLFEIDPTPGYHSATIVISVDEKATCCCRPVDREQDWLDVKRGHQLYVSGKRRTFQCVRLYRSVRTAGRHGATITSHTTRNPMKGLLSQGAVIG